MTYTPKHRGMCNEDIDEIPIDRDGKVMRLLRDLMLKAVEDDVEEFAMDLIGDHPRFDPVLIEDDKFTDGPMVHLENRIWWTLSDMLMQDRGGF